MMQIDSSLRFFTNHLQPRAIVIRGSWGVGKTYYWREKIVKGFFANAKIKKANRGYAYASLFGIESIQQLKNALAYSYEENQPLGYLPLLCNWMLDRVRSAGEFLSKYLSDELSITIKNVGAKVKPASLLNDFAFLSIKGSLICIDDLERRNKKLSIGDVLGLVSYLVDQRRCRVALILNFDALDDSEMQEWERAKDKTFESEFVYEPSMEASIEIGMLGTELEWWHEEAKACLRKLQVGNIRVIVRTQRFLQQLISSLKSDSRLEEIPNDVWIEAIRVSCLLVVAHNSRAMGAPSIEKLLSGTFEHLLTEDQPEELTPKEKKWKKIVEDYGLHLGDSLDTAIAQSIKDGYPRMDLLAPASLDWREAQVKNTRLLRLRQVWTNFHESLGMDMEEQIESFVRALTEAVLYESVHNVSSTGSLLRELGRPDAATDAYQKWIVARLGDRRRELEEDDWFPGMQINAEFLEMIEHARTNEQKPARPLLDALTQIDSGNWSLVDIEAVAAADPASIADSLRSQRRTWRNCIQILSTYGGHDGIGDRARENLMDALREIAGTSLLNEIRVKSKLGNVALHPVL